MNQYGAETDLVAGLCKFLPANSFSLPLLLKMPTSNNHDRWRSIIINHHFNPRHPFYQIAGQTTSGDFRLDGCVDRPVQRSGQAVQGEEWW